MKQTYIPILVSEDCTVYGTFAKDHCKDDALTHQKSA